MARHKPLHTALLLLVLGFSSTAYAAPTIDTNFQTILTWDHLDQVISSDGAENTSLSTFSDALGIQPDDSGYIAASIHKPESSDNHYAFDFYGDHVINFQPETDAIDLSKSDANTVALDTHSADAVLNHTINVDGSTEANALSSEDGDTLYLSSQEDSLTLDAPHTNSAITPELKSSYDLSAATIPEIEVLNTAAPIYTTLASLNDMARTPGDAESITLWAEHPENTPLIAQNAKGNWTLNPSLNLALSNPENNPQHDITHLWANDRSILLAAQKTNDVTPETILRTETMHWIAVAVNHLLPEHSSDTDNRLALMNIIMSVALQNVSFPHTAIANPMSERFTRYAMNHLDSFNNLPDSEKVASTEASTQHL